MLNGGQGIAQLNMNNGDNRIVNLRWVNLAEACKLLMEFACVRYDGDFRLTPDHAAAGCARASSRGAKCRERGSPPAHVTEDRPYMCRLSLVEGDHPSGAKVV